jgi:ribosomal-protein-alanine N-acetyltransferase
VEVRIREYREGELEMLWRIDQECFQPGIAYSSAELGYYMRLKGAFTLVAEARENGRKWRPVGFVVGQRHARGLGHIITIDVLPEARRDGIGTRLMEESEARLKTAGCHSIYLETAVDNESALKFYKRHGYYVLKVIPRYYLDKIDALLLAKKLV